jgi:HEAT repeat protein
MRRTILSLRCLSIAVLCLVSLLHAEEPLTIDQRAQTALRAGQEQDLASLQQLTQFLKDDATLVRRSSAWALGRFDVSSPDMVRALTIALTDADAQVRWAAAYALGHMGPAALPATGNLWQATCDRDVDVRCAALVALRTVSVTKHRAELPSLRECLRCSIAEVQSEAVATLAAVQARWTDAEKSRILPDLASLFETANDDLRLEIAMLVGDFGLSSGPMISQLADAVDDLDEHVQAASLRALARFGDQLSQRWPQLDSQQRQTLRHSGEVAASALARDRTNAEEGHRLADHLRRLLNQSTAETADDTSSQAQSEDHAESLPSATLPSPAVAADDTWIAVCGVLLVCLGIWGLREHWARWRAASSTASVEPTPVADSGKLSRESTQTPQASPALSIAVANSHSAVQASSTREVSGSVSETPVPVAPRIASLATFQVTSVDEHSQTSGIDSDWLRRQVPDFTPPNTEPENPQLWVSLLQQELSDPSPKTRARAAFELGQMGPAAQGALDQVARLVSDPDVSVRRHAASALGGIGSDTDVALNALRKALQDSDASVRRCAITALALRKSEAAFDDLQRALSDADPQVRKCAALALAAHGLDSVTKREVAAANAEEVSLRVGREVAKDSEPVPETSTTASSVKLYRPNEAGDAELAAEDVRKPAPHPSDVHDFIAQLEDADSDVRWRASQQLVQLGTAALPPILTSLNHRNPEVRRLLVGTLGHLGPAAQSALPELLVALHDVNADVRAAAAECLGRIGTATPELVQALIAALSDPNSEVRRYAATSLGRLGSQALAAKTALQVTAISDAAAKVRSAAQTAVHRVSNVMGAAA